MKQGIGDYMKTEYRLDQATPISTYEINTYNAPFAGNTSTCREIFTNGKRALEFSADADVSLRHIMQKPVFRDELVEYIFSISRQMVSMNQNGLSLEKIVWDRDRMFVRFSDFSVQLLYLPIEAEFHHKDLGQSVKNLLSEFTYAHTSAVECANQIADYFDEHKEFDIYGFNTFVSEMRSTSQLLTIQGEKNIDRTMNRAQGDKREQAIMNACEAARRADEARRRAESEVKRQTEEARLQAEKARQAEETRLKAEAARVEAEIRRQRAEAEARDYEETAVLAGDDDSQNNDLADKDARFNASIMLRNVEEEIHKAEKMSSRYADEIRKAREQEMQAEEARIQAEFAARKNAEEARRQAELSKRQTEEAKRLRESSDEELPTILVSNRNITPGNCPTLTRRSTGETVRINKQVFCVGKADQGVDFKITGNKSVSRRHAYITSINGVNYLRDNNSTNHTYLNGTQIYSNIDVSIPDNSIIKLSNEEFIFRSST